MKYATDILAITHEPDRLEELYQHSMQANEEAEFRADLQEAYEKTPDNILLSAWRSRFAHAPMARVKRTTHWVLAVVMGVISGLILWQINPEWFFMNQVPYLVMLWAPIITVFVLVFLAITSKRNYVYTAVACAVLIIASAYVLLIASGQAKLPRNDYLNLMAIQLPLLCWIAIGIAVMGLRSSFPNRFAFLIKSIEVMIAAGLYLIFGMIFGMITVGMFQALDVNLPDILIRLFAGGGIGLVSFMAIATMYDPHVLPAAQDFSQGLSKFIFIMMRLLLPLTLIVLLIYIFVIPFNFMAPFQNRDLLIIYNVMQFAIIGLLIGVTPFKVEDLSPRLQIWLRRGIIAIAILALLISLYALSAVVYRTVTGVLTLNRTTIIGWNLINIGILVALILTQLRKGTTAWHERLQSLFSRATTAYLIWSVVLTLALPLIFR